MANYATLKAAIADVIKTNGANAITGALLQSSLLSMIDSLGAGYQFGGVAIPSTNPGTPDQNIFYIGGPGEYINFGTSAIIPYGAIGIFKYNGSWSVNKIEIGHDFNCVTFIGGGTDGLITEFALTPNMKYNIVIPNTNWDTTGVPSGYNIFSFGYVDGNGQSHDIIGVSKGATPKELYTITAVEAKNYYLFCRAATGVKVYFSVVPLIQTNLTFTLTGNVMPNINTQTGILDLGADPNVMVGNMCFNSSDFESESDYRAIQIQKQGDGESSRRKLVFNIGTKKFRTYDYGEKLSYNEVLVGSFVTAYSTTGYIANSFKYANLPFEYTIDGSNSSADIKKINGFGFSPSFIIGLELPNIDTTNKVLDLGPDPVFYIGNDKYGFSELYPNNPEYYRAIPIYDVDSASGAIKLIFNVSTKRIYAKQNAYKNSLVEVVIGGFRLGYSSHTFLAANLPFEYTIDGRNIYEAGNSKQYNGIRPNFANRYKYKALFTLSQYGSLSGVDTQGMDVYNDRYLFQGNNPSSNNNSIYVVDLLNKQILGSFAFSEQSHLNTINCGPKFTDSDTYPLLYVSQCYYDRKCEIIRIANDLSGYTLIQQIKYVGTQYLQGVSAADWMIDDNYIYHYSTVQGTTTILKFAKPQIGASVVEFSDADILDVYSFDDTAIYQGGKIIDNQIFIPFGFDTIEYPAYIKVFDLKEKRVVTDIPLDGLGETEALGKYKDGIIIVNNSTNPTYRYLTF